MFIATKVDQFVFDHIRNYELQFSSLLSAHRPVSSSEAMHKHVLTPFHPFKVSMTVRQEVGWLKTNLYVKQISRSYSSVSRQPSGCSDMQ